MVKKYHITVILAAMLLTGLVLVRPACADDTAQLKGQVQALQQRVNQLESQLADDQQVTVPGMPVYDQTYDPFTQMMLIERQMDHRLDQSFAQTGTFTPRTDMRQTDKQYVITMDIPGMDKDKISVEVKNDMLVISGERRSETENNTRNKTNHYYRQERFFGTFMQAIPLPEDAEKAKINASYKNGVLTVIIDRMPHNKPQAQKIKVN